MKALHIPSFLPASTSYRSLTPTTIPTPLPSPTNIIVTITHASLNHVDLLYVRGLHQNNHSGLVSPPFILGLEFCGVVTSLPTTPQLAGSCGFEVGDRVWGHGLGAYAEKVSCAPSAVRKLPRGFSLLDAAGLGAGSAPVSYGALMHGGIQKGQIVLVHGAAGSLGAAAVQIAAGLGCRVIGTVGSEAKAEALRRVCGEQLGGVVRYDRTGWEKEVVEVAERLGGKAGVDLVYDTVGLVLSSIRCVRFNGKIVIAGFAGREGKMETLAMNRVLLKNVQLLGYRFGQSSREGPKHGIDSWDGVDRLLESGKIKPMIYRVWEGLDTVGEALQELFDRKVYGKGVVLVQKEDDILQQIASSQSKL